MFNSHWITVSNSRPHPGSWQLAEWWSLSMQQRADCSVAVYQGEASYLGSANSEGGKWLWSICWSFWTLTVYWWLSSDNHIPPTIPAQTFNGVPRNTNNNTIQWCKKRRQGTVSTSECTAATASQKVMRGWLNVKDTMNGTMICVCPFLKSYSPTEQLSGFVLVVG